MRLACNDQGDRAGLRGCCCCSSHSAYWLLTRKNYLTQWWPIPLVICCTGKIEQTKKSGSVSRPHAARSEKINKNHLTHPQGVTQASVGLASVQGYSSRSTINRPKGVAPQNSTLPCAITAFLVFGQFNRYTHKVHTHTLIPSWEDDRDRLRGYAQFNRYVHTHAQTKQTRDSTTRWVNFVRHKFASLRTSPVIHTPWR